MTTREMDQVRDFLLWCRENDIQPTRLRLNGVELDLAPTGYMVSELGDFSAPQNSSIPDPAPEETMDQTTNLYDGYLKRLPQRGR